MQPWWEDSTFFKTLQNLSNPKLLKKKKIKSLCAALWVTESLLKTSDSLYSSPFKETSIWEVYIIRFLISKGVGMSEFPPNMEKSTITLSHCCRLLWDKVRQASSGSTINLQLTNRPCIYISPALHLAGEVVAGSRAGELHSLAVESGVPEEVAEVFEKLQKFVRSVLENCNDLCG